MILFWLIFRCTFGQNVASAEGMVKETVDMKDF